MNKKKLFSIGLIALGLIFSNSVFAVGLTVELESEPLFNNANFLPGNSVERWAKVTNTGVEEKAVVVEAINWSGFPNSGDIPSTDLSRALEIVIEESGTELYSDSLFNFYDQGEVFLSTLSAGALSQYDFNISFPEESGNDWQGMITGFDILIGFGGEEGGGDPGSGGGGGGGGAPRGLTIAEPVELVEVTETSITINWMTNYMATSEVVYGSELENHTFDLSAVNYGYEHTSVEDLNKVTVHSVTITGLIPGTTYYYRCVSHGSFAMSTEYTFTTLELEEEIQPTGELIFTGQELEKIVRESVNIVQERSGQKIEVDEEGLVAEIKEIFTEDVKEDLNIKSSWFLASIRDLLDSVNIYLVLIFLLVFIIIILLLRKRKKEKED